MAPDEHEALADVSQDVDVQGLVGMQAHEHQAATIAKAAEEVEHEADVAVLCIELWFVEQMNAGALGVCALLQESGLEASVVTHLVRLVVMHGQSVTLGRSHLVDVA